MDRFKVAVTGASGKMGCAIIKGLSQFAEIQIVAAIDIQNIGKDAGELAGISSLGVQVTDKLEQVLKEKKPEVVIDFTHKKAAQKNIPIILEKSIAVVAGTTGLNEEDLVEFDRLAKQNNTSMFLAPNFSLGAVLMMKFAREAGKYYTQGEIIEYHNDKKIDSPSGTAIATARNMTKGFSGGEAREQYVSESSCRGGDFGGVKIHSVRLKSLVAHQEVLFAGTGELLTIRHDSFARESFIPGILMAVRKVQSWQGLKVGLEEILELEN
jgi:4-hydroxy-tetrahydrodipicolinate reductase